MTCSLIAEIVNVLQVKGDEVGEHSTHLYMLGDFFLDDYVTHS